MTAGHTDDELKRHGTDAHYTLGASRAIRPGDNKFRIIATLLVFLILYGLIGTKLVMLGMSDAEVEVANLGRAATFKTTRPDLLDRNGEILATDIKTASLFAEPNRIEDVDETIEKLGSVLPELGSPKIRKRLESNAGFAWLKREISPVEQRAIHNLGLPGIGFQNESQRYYPGNNLASHVVGHVNIDNQGIAGIEKYLDDQGLADLQSHGFTDDQPLEPIVLSLDRRVQHALRDELGKAIEKYQALAAIGIVIDVNTGEVIGMSSLPDYNPNNPTEALEQKRMNRASAGVFEMGSVLKILTVAMALDSGNVSITDSFDATQPIRVARHTIRDYRGKKRVLSVPEVFIYSSNIGTAKLMLAAGIDVQTNFLEKTGMLSGISTEIPETAKPLLPAKWNELSAMTVSFGHGLSVTPLHTAAAVMSLVNGGRYIPPTFLSRPKEEAEALSKRVITESTSETMRYLMRLNVLEGSGRRSDVPGYRLGGKTGTAEKVENGRYVSEKRFNSFIAVFPIDDPRYLVLVALDEPQPEEGLSTATAGLNAGPTTAAITGRIATMMGIEPREGEPQFMIEGLQQQEDELAGIQNVNMNTTQ